MKAEILLSNGQVLDLYDPDPAVIDIDTIAMSLSKLCRFTGHTKRFYSVAEHCILVSTLVPNRLRMQGLLHDAAEAFVGDMTSPLKRTQPTYKLVETVVEQAVMERFGILCRGDDAARVKRADLIAGATEAEALMPDHPTYWKNGSKNGFIGVNSVNPPWHLGLTSSQAERFFLERFKEVS